MIEGRGLQRGLYHPISLPILGAIVKAFDRMLFEVIIQRD
jgi:hypothetical protein